MLVFYHNDRELQEKIDCMTDDDLLPYSNGVIDFQNFGKRSDS